MTLQIASPFDFEIKPEEVQLPSQRGTDKAVLLRRPDLVALIGGDGEIPDVLTGLVMAGIKGERQEFDLTPESVPQIMKSLDIIAIATFVAPKLWHGDEVSDDGRMPVGWLKFEDKGFVFAWALGAEYQPAASFRPEQNGHVGSVQSRHGVPRKAERHVRAKK